MKISDIYKRKLNLPPNLQLHMHRVAGVANVVVDHWKGPRSVDRNAITHSTLLHDVGNLVKYDLDRLPHLLGESEASRIPYWKEVQRKFIDKYGREEHEATTAILDELGVVGRIRELVSHSGSYKVDETLVSDDIERKICLYADARIGPFGVVSIDERWDDVVERYKNSSHALSNRENIEHRRIKCHELEKQIQENVDIALQSISDTDIKPYLKTLLSYDIRTVET